MVDARLPDGSRVNAIIPPLALDGPCLSIRRFGRDPLKAEDMIRNRSLIPAMLDLLHGCVRARLNVLISGGTGAGKTTLLNVLSGFISNRERIVSIEDAPSCSCTRNTSCVWKRARPISKGKGRCTRGNW
jgi:pilus assembly protein CpaF